ncbi:MAG: TadE/TadG family type IV pilus assembly protein [Asticcacaulis sp.]
MLKLSFRSRFYASTSGASAVEFAMISPLFILMLAGIINYGSYFSNAHAVQQMVNDAARTAIAGTTAAERLELAQAVMDHEVGRYSFLAQGQRQLAISEGAQIMTVTLTFSPDSESFALFPMPAGLPSTITRSASIVRGGY